MWEKTVKYDLRGVMQFKKSAVFAVFPLFTIIIIISNFGRASSPDEAILLSFLGMFLAIFGYIHKLKEYISIKYYKTLHLFWNLSVSIFILPVFFVEILSLQDQYCGYNLRLEYLYFEYVIRYWQIFQFLIIIKLFQLVLACSIPERTNDESAFIEKILASPDAEASLLTSLPAERLFLTQILYERSNQMTKRARFLLLSIIVLIVGGVSTIYVAGDLGSGPINGIPKVVFA
jgi:hypothetical protein